MSDTTEAFFYRLRGADLVIPSACDDACAFLGLENGPELVSTAAFETATFQKGDSRVTVLLENKDAVLEDGWRIIAGRAAIVEAAGNPSVGGAGREVAMTAFLSALHVSQWRRESRFCGSCGAENGDAPDELARLCPVCGRREYPRISPAVIVLVEDDRGRILLAHNAHFRPGVFSLLAGFTEAGETLEKTVAREIREEVGIEVSDIRYVSSQSWPFPNSLMLAFHARHAGGKIVPDGKEILEAAWYESEALPDLPFPGSIARTLIEAWMAEKKLR